MPGRVEARREILNQHHRHVELPGMDLDLGVGKRELAQVTDLVRPVEGVEQDRPLVEGQTAEVLAVAQGNLADRHLPGLLQRLPQKLVRLDPDGLGFEVVGTLDVDAGVDLGVVAELQDLDGPGRVQGQVFQLLVLDADVLVLADLEAADGVVPTDLTLLDRAPALVPERRAVPRAEESEGDPLGLVGEVHPHRDGDHPEADGTPPHRPGHRSSICGHPRSRRG